jgi:NTE family protein
MDGEDEFQDSALARLFLGRSASADTSRISLPGGRILFAAGDPADTLYFVRTGRLGVVRREDGHEQQVVGVIRSGEPVGEMALIAGTPHTSTVIAIRDSEILALPRQVLLAEAQKRPRVMAELARLVILRMRETAARAAASDPTVFGFVGLDPAIAVRDFLDQVQIQLVKLGFTAAVVGREGLQAPIEWFSAVEYQHDFVLYAAEAGEVEWMEVCGRQVDRLFLIGDGEAKPPNAASGFAAEVMRQHRLIDLILMHAPKIQRPKGTGAWLDALGANRVLHLRHDDEGDTARLARVVSGTAVGLVLSGGGSRAYAHVGAVKALREAGNPIDFIGGCSMGAIVGAGVALGWTDEQIDARIQDAFVASSPVADIAFPMIALARGSRVAARLSEHFGAIDIADLWLPFFCVSSNLTTGTHQIHRRGRLTRALQASSAVPGVLPPVIDGDDVLVDGAVLRNFPADVMRGGHRGPIVGIDVSRSRGLSAKDVAGPESIWRWILSGAWMRGPPIVSLLMRSATVSSVRDVMAARDATDVLVLPQVEKIEIRDWKAYVPAVEAGHAATVQALAQLEGPLTHVRRRKAAQAQANLPLPAAPELT